jgi:superfamily II DNA or RNA helicase
MKSNKQLRRDKLVIASNFISTLNTIEPIIKAAGHQFLRIDGSVASDKRQNIVDLFNNENSAFSVCLISVKAGGVGLNLIGANRLLLFEPDWNPATDAQAIGRVWRVGQKKEVFIYRLVCASSIEESIVARQQHKNLLSSVITERKSKKEMDRLETVSKAKNSVSSSQSNERLAAMADPSSADFSHPAPGVLLELLLPSSDGGFGMDVDDCSDVAQHSHHHKSSSTVSGSVNEQQAAADEEVEYDDIVLKKLVSDTLVTCQVKVKMV